MSGLIYCHVFEVESMRTIEELSTPTSRLKIASIWAKMASCLSPGRQSRPECMIASRSSSDLANPGIELGCSCSWLVKGLQFAGLVGMLNLTLCTRGRMVASGGWLCLVSFYVKLHCLVSKFSCARISKGHPIRHEATGLSVLLMCVGKPLRRHRYWQEGGLALG